MNESLKPRLSSKYMLYKEGQKDKEEYYLFNISEGNVFQLNSVSYDFLELCNGEHTNKEICEMLSKMYSTDIAVLQNDFSGLYSSWMESNIIEEL